MSGDDEDDWEKAEQNIKIIDPPKKPSVVIPARLLTRPVQEINFFPDSPITPPPQPPVLTIPPISYAYDEPIDKALMDAVQNPRERMQVLNIEHLILSFVRSSERTMEFPPGFNSFRRLLTYRVAHRFRVERTASDTYNELGDRGILLFKTLETCIPRQLLIDLKVDNPELISMDSLGRYPIDMYQPHSYAAETFLTDNIPNTTSTANNTFNGKTVKVARRPKPEESKKNKPPPGASQQSILDKERQYAEARARIFGEEAGASGGLRTPSPSIPAAAVGESTAAAGTSSLEKDPKVVASPPLATPAEVSARPSTGLSTGRGESKPISATSRPFQPPGVAPPASGGAAVPASSSASASPVVKGKPGPPFGTIKSPEPTSPSSVLPKGKLAVDVPAAGIIAKPKSGEKSPLSPLGGNSAKSAGAGSGKKSDSGIAVPRVDEDKIDELLTAADLSLFAGPAPGSSLSLSDRGEAGGVGIMKRVVDPALWMKDKRYTARNIEAERSDPDFARRGGGGGGGYSGGGSSHLGVGVGGNGSQNSSSSQMHSRPMDHHQSSPYQPFSPHHGSYAQDNGMGMYQGPMGYGSGQGHGGAGGQGSPYGMGMGPSHMYPLPVAPTLQLPGDGRGGQQGMQSWGAQQSPHMMMHHGAQYYPAVPMGMGAPVYPPMYAHHTPPGHYQQHQQSAPSNSSSGGRIFNKSDFPTLGGGGVGSGSGR